MKGKNMTAAVIVAIFITIFTLPLFGISLGYVVSGSMEPMLSRGDLLMVQKIDPEKLCLGDVVVYSAQGIRICHRIYRLGEKEIITKGDALTKADAPIERAIVNKQVIGHIPLLGYVPMAANTPVGMGAVCFLILSCMVLLIYLSQRKDRKRQER